VASVVGLQEKLDFLINLLVITTHLLK